MIPLPASLRAILLDPGADPNRADGIRVLPWRLEDCPFPRRSTAVLREGRAVAALVVTTVAECCHVAVLRRGRGGPGRPRTFLTLTAATAAAERMGVAHALSLKAQRSQTSKGEPA